MNFKEIEAKIIEEADKDNEDYKRYFADYSLSEDIFGKVETVDEEGGHEGGGEYMYVVKHFIDHNVYIRLEGFYTSYNGTDFDDYDLEEVFPVDRVVTFYEPKTEKTEL